MKRRTFLRNTSTATAAFAIVPGGVLGFSPTAPSDRIRVGFIGAGRQGRGLMKAFTKYDEVEIAAVSEIDARKMTFFSGEFQKALLENQGKTATLKEFRSYRDLLDQTDIDAVVISTPDHWHAQMSVDAAKAGKDIYCEKPLASSVAEGRAMVESAEKYKVVFQTGSMQRSWDDFRHGVELIRNGYIGDIKEINVAVGPPDKECDLPSQETPDNIDWNAWIGPAPYRDYHFDLACPMEDTRWAKWRDYKPYGGGMVADWGAHMFDIVQWALGMDGSGPVKFLPPEDPMDFGLKYEYENGISVTHGKWGENNNEIQFIGSEGVLEVSRNYLKTYPKEDLATTPLKDSDTNRVYKSENHHKDWLNAIRSRKRPICDAEIGHRTSTICNVANIAYDLQRPLEWDPKKEQFVNDPGANMLLGRAYRGDWDYMDF